MLKANDFVKALAAKYPEAKIDNLQDCIITTATYEECSGVLFINGLRNYPTIEGGGYTREDGLHCLWVNEDDNDSA